MRRSAKGLPGLAGHPRRTGQHCVLRVTWVAMSRVWHPLSTERSSRSPDLQLFRLTLSLQLGLCLLGARQACKPEIDVDMRTSCTDAVEEVRQSVQQRSHAEHAACGNAEAVQLPPQLWKELESYGCAKKLCPGRICASGKVVKRAAVTKHLPLAEPQVTSSKTE